MFKRAMMRTTRNRRSSTRSPWDELPDFSRRQIANVARTEVADADRSDADALQADDWVGDHVAHPPNLAVPALVQPDDDRRPRAARGLGRVLEPDLGRTGAAALDDHPVAQAIEIAVVGHAFDERLVRAIDFVARVRHALGELAVVREQDQPLGLVVETTHGIEVAADAGARDQIHDRRPLLRIEACADHPPRLVHEEVASAGLQFQPAPVDFDDVGGRVGLRAKFADDAPVDLDPPLRDECLGGPPGGDAGLRQDLLEADRHAAIADRQCIFSSPPPSPPPSNGSAVWGAGSPTVAGKSKPRSSDMSSTLGRSDRSFRPKRVRNSRVVPYRKGRPTTCFRPTTFTSFRSIKVPTTPAVCTPRISAISGAVTG